MTASNAQGFKFDYDSQSGKYGYVVSEGGADTFVPFSSGGGIKSIALGQGSMSYSSQLTYYIMWKKATITLSDDSTISITMSPDNGTSVALLLDSDLCEIRSISSTYFRITLKRSAYIDGVQHDSGYTQNFAFNGGTPVISV